MVLPKGSDFTFELSLSIDRVVTGASYSNYTLTERLAEPNRYQTITFHHVEYSTLIHLDISQAIKITCRGNQTSQCEYVAKTHLRVNTPIDETPFAKEGYALVGWQNDGETIGLGSRVNANKDIVLDAVYLPEEAEANLAIEILDDRRVAIQGYSGKGDTLVLPRQIQGRNVVSIGKGALKGLILKTLVLPRTLSQIEAGAFEDCHIQELVLFENLVNVSDACFVDTSIQKLRINATKGPAYIRTYFGTYAEKMDRLIALEKKKKILLYSGSSTRFGFDSEAIDKTFLGYDVVNMGVFAYTASYPQVDLLSHYLQAEDVVLVSPEFDAIEEQIHLEPIFDWATFALCEANYDLLSLLDISQYDRVFDAFGEYQHRRNNLPRYAYSDSPYQYDEDGGYRKTPTYNAYGDYSLYRENNASRKPFGVKRAYYNKTHFPQEYLDQFDDCFDLVRGKGAALYYDYSPRMDISISEDSTPASIAELGSYLEENIAMEFLSSIEESLMDPLYFHGTDNHLSSEGASIRTKRVIQALGDRLER